MTSEQKARLTGLIVRYALYAWVAIIAIPFTIMAIKGWLLLITLMCIIGGTLAVAPALQMAAQNWRLKLIKDQARRNPVETMQNIYVEKQKELKDKAEVLNIQRAKRATYMRKLSSFKQRFPDEAEYFETAAQRMTALLHQNEQKYIIADKATQVYAGEVEKTQAIWEMGKAAEEANKGFQFTDDDFLTKIKSETAIESAREQLDIAFSDLDQSLLESQSQAPTGNPLPEPAKAAFQKALT